MNDDITLTTFVDAANAVPGSMLGYVECWPLGFSNIHRFTAPMTVTITSLTMFVARNSDGRVIGAYLPTSGRWFVGSATYTLGGALERVA